MIHRLLPLRTKYTLNIGLNPRSSNSMFGSPLLTWHIHARVLKWLKQMMPQADHVIIEDWMGEPTMVVQGYLVSWPWSPASDAVKLHQLANLLHQDCLAVVRDEDSFAFLVGPAAKQWGKFDSSRFLQYEEAQQLRSIERLVNYMEQSNMEDQRHAEIPRNCMRQRLEGRAVVVGYNEAPNLSPTTVDIETVEVVRDVPALSYKPAHGGNHSQVR
jgi:hypothetical protein